MSRQPALRRFLALVVGATVMAGSLGATGASTAASTAAVRAAVPKQWDRRIEPIAREVAKLRKLDFEHPVAAEFLGEAAFEKRVAVDRGKLSARDQRDIDRSEAQLRAVGLIGPDVDVVDAVGSLQSSGVLAYYDPKTKKITVKGTDLDDVSTRVTVAHELTHALQDQHFDLQKLERRARARHGSTVLRTIAEGDAVRIEDAYTETLSSADQRAHARENAQLSQEVQSEIASKQVPDTLNVVFQAPYVLGPSMLDSVLAKENDAGVDALFEDPPTADAAFVTPSTVVDHRTFQTVQPPALLPGEERSGKPDVFGALSLFQVLSSRIDNATALSAADAWDGDAMVTFTRNDQTCLRATFAGRGTQGTTTITDALQQWAEQMPSGAATVERADERARERVTLTACDPGTAATAIPNQPIGSLVYLASRDGLFAELLKGGISTPAATCTADALVRDPVFAPVIEAAEKDPTAQPDSTVVAALQARVPAIVRECTRT